MKYLFFIAIILAAITLSSCLRSDNNLSYEDWRVENEDYFARMKDTLDADGNNYYTEIASLAYPSLQILYHEITPGAENGRTPFITSTVKVNYSGRLYNTETRFDSGTGVQFGVNKVITGWTLALQHMKEGSKWRIVIPYQLAYGISGQGSIPPYSTLTFDVELVSIPYWEVPAP